MCPPQKTDLTSRISPRAWYQAIVTDFLSASPDFILGQLALNSTFHVLPEQRDAWAQQIAILKKELAEITGHIFLEFNIPRMGKRADVVLLTQKVLFVIEFKVGAEDYSSNAIEQAWDYALDLKNFHKGSHAIPIVPLLVSTNVSKSENGPTTTAQDAVTEPILCSPSDIKVTIELFENNVISEKINPAAWKEAPYQPTPTIIEAARALYANHSVHEISRSDAGAINLSQTSQLIESLISDAKKNKKKIICFVTGVPGSGKTLVGLNIANQHKSKDALTHAVFLSGNGPLVSVLKESLARDEVERSKHQRDKVKKTEALRKVSAFIQNIHHFRDDSLNTEDPPFEHVVIFDEAQRAWNLRKTANFMASKKKRPGFAKSEPNFLISCLERHQEDPWAVIVCLVGGGQEINTGEAGISEWLEAINSDYSHWETHISPQLESDEYDALGVLKKMAKKKNVYFAKHLHLSTSMRSFRSENVSSFIHQVLNCNSQNAKKHLVDIRETYPISITRDIDLAKCWVREKARGSERYGLLASSKAQRLKPHAIDIRVNIDPVHWFLNNKNDTRSSYYLEDAATEFQVQGLELDWACVTWDADLRYSPDGWSYHDFRGSNWCNINSPENRRYLKNAYRVLLTRARQGMVIFVPTGSKHDATRLPSYYNHTYEYLKELGLPEIK